MPTVASVMSRNLAVIAPAATLVDAARALVERRVGSVLVLDGERLAGILTERDMLRAAASGEDLNATKVKDWMTGDPITASPDMDTEEAAAVMFTNGFRHLPVTQGSEVVGVVSLRDVLSARIRRRS